MDNSKERAEFVETAASSLNELGLHLAHIRAIADLVAASCDVEGYDLDEETIPNAMSAIEHFATAAAGLQEDLLTSVAKQR